jgi:hypothetical protein
MKDKVKEIFLKKKFGKVLSNALVTSLLAVASVWAGVLFSTTTFEQNETSYISLFVFVLCSIALYIVNEYFSLSTADIEMKKLQNEKTQALIERDRCVGVLNRHTHAKKAMTDFILKRTNELVDVRKKEAKAKEKGKTRGSIGTIDLLRKQKMDDHVHDLLTCIQDVFSIDGVGINVVFMNLNDKNELEIADDRHYALDDLTIVPYMLRKKLTMKEHEGCAGQTLANKKIQIFPDTTNIEAYRKLDSRLKENGFVSLVCMPVCLSNEYNGRQTCGILNISADKPNYFQQGVNAEKEIKTLLNPFILAMIEIYTHSTVIDEMSSEIKE